MMFATRASGNKVSPGSECGQWTALGQQFRIRKVWTASGSNKTNMASRWFCVAKCSCGTIAAVDVASLASGLSSSCGCVRTGTDGGQEPPYLPKPADIRRAREWINQHWSEAERQIRSVCIPVGKRDLLALKSQ